MTDEELGRAEAERLGVSPSTCEFTHSLRWVDLPSPLGLDGDYDLWSEVGQAYAALGRAVLACRAACGYDEALARQAATIAELQRWKDAIIDAAVVNWTLSGDDETNPHGAVNKLICHAVDLERHELQEQVKSLTQERDAARAERDELGNRAREVTCVWCGFQFTSTLRSQADHFYEHAKTCEKHPIHKAESALAAERERREKAERERDEAIKDRDAAWDSLDKNYVTHWQIINSRKRAEKAEAERDAALARVKELEEQLLKEPSGDQRSQAAAWSQVYKTCEEIGLLSFLPHPIFSPGVARVCQFIEAIDQDRRAFRNCLKEIASFSEGEVVTSKFDNPADANTARKALAAARVV